MSVVLPNYVIFGEGASVHLTEPENKSKLSKYLYQVHYKLHDTLQLKHSQQPYTKVLIIAVLNTKWLITQRKRCLKNKEINID